MSAKSRTAINPIHINNRYLLLPIEDVIERALAEYAPANHMKKSDPSTATDRHRERALKWFQGKNIHFLGQLLLGAFLEDSYGPLPKILFHKALGDMGFEVNEYIVNMAINPRLKATFMDPDVTFTAGVDGHLYPSYPSVSKPFAGKSREDIGNALKRMFEIEGPIPEPGLQPLTALSADNEHISDAEGIEIILTDAWQETARRVLSDAMLQKIAVAIATDAQIQGEISGAKSAAILGAEFPPEQDNALQGPDVVILDATPLTMDLARLFGNAASQLNRLVEANLQARNSVIQSRVREIITAQTATHLGLDSLK